MWEGRPSAVPLGTARHSPQARRVSGHLTSYSSSAQLMPYGNVADCIVVSSFKF
jgi:hypothetical protein